MIESEHEGKRFLASLNASLTIDEMKEVAKKAGVTSFKAIYPFSFSEKNMKKYNKKIAESKVKENEFNRLSAVYLIKK